MLPTFYQTLSVIFYHHHKVTNITLLRNPLKPDCMAERIFQMQDRPNEYALEYKLGSEDERQFLVFTTTDFRLVLSTAEPLIEFFG